MTTPTNLFLCAKNVLDLEHCTITATPSLVSSMPVNHLKLSSRGRVARSVGDAASQEFKFTWGGDGNYLNFFSLYRHNLLPAATWRVICYPNADWTGTPVADSGDVAMYDAYTLGDYGADWGYLPLGYSQAVFYPQPRFSTFYFTRAGVLSIKATITNPGTEDGYVDVCRAFAGEGYELTYNHDSVSLGWKDDGKLTASEGGSPRVDSAYQYRLLSLNVPWISSDQREALLDMQRYAGSTLDYFVSVYPSETGALRRDYELIGKAIESKEIELPRNNPYAIYATSFKFREM